MPSPPRPSPPGTAWHSASLGLRGPRAQARRPSLSAGHTRSPLCACSRGADFLPHVSGQLIPDRGGETSFPGTAPWCVLECPGLSVALGRCVGSNGHPAGAAALGRLCQGRGLATPWWPRPTGATSRDTTAGASWHLLWDCLWVRRLGPPPPAHGPADTVSSGRSVSLADVLCVQGSVP